MQAKSAAFVVHKTPSRIRIKIPGRKGQQAYFAALQYRVAAHPEVIVADVNALIGSVVIHCRKGCAIAVARWLAGVGLAVVDVPADAPARQFAPDGVYGFSDGSLAFANCLYELVMAIATGGIAAKLLELLIEAMLRAGGRSLDTQAGVPPNSASGSGELRSIGGGGQIGGAAKMKTLPTR
jgi:hypothetical protein